MNETNRVPVLNNTPVCAVPHRLVAVGNLEADTKQEHKANTLDKPLLLLANAPLVTITKTIHCKVRDECVRWLNKAAREVNTVWNYSNELHHKAYHNYHGKRTLLSAFDLNRYVAGCGEVFSHIGIDIAQCVNAELATRCKQFKQSKLRFRKSFAPRKSLGWIPFKVANLSCKSRTEKKIEPLAKRANESSKAFRMRKAKWVNKCNNGTTKKTTHSLVFMGKTIRIHQFDRYLNIRNSSITVRQGNFAEDSCGNWYLNQTFDISVAPLPALHGKESYVGIDPGCKTSATAVGYDSNGTKHVHVLDCSFLKDELATLKMLQRRGHKKQAKLLHQKIVNKRNDAIHKWSAELVSLYEHIFYGNANILPKKNSQKQKRLQKSKEKQTLQEKQPASTQQQNKGNSRRKTTSKNHWKNQGKGKTKSFGLKGKARKGLHRSRLDAAWGKQKQGLTCKGHWTGRTVMEVSERNTSITCCRCEALTGPRGLSMLDVRQWVCSACTTEHDRDENAGDNIVQRGMSVIRAQRRAEASASGETGLPVKREHEQAAQRAA